ncbi:hypothetical protein M2E15_5533 [Bacillus mycoides]|uniref:hypothetical protein n=1 Tax=Bacillus mycoides TaxID=1405 RepID=UPI00073F931E|nr:hypothetical protein [Bacillus mycoides]KUH44108.1 hypothetical protein M2E15_5533 [Bacillus mycoides]
MNNIIKDRFINKYSIGSFIAFLLIVFFSFFVSSSIFESIFLYDYSKGDLAGKSRFFLAENYLFKSSTWELMTFDSIYYSLFLFTLPATFPIIRFYNEGKGYFVHAYTRIKNYKRSLLGVILQYSIISGLCFAGPYLLFYLFVACFNSNYINSQIGLLNSINSYISFNNAIVYFVVICFVVNFIFGSIYGFFACTIALWTEKVYFIVLIPIIYYLVMSNIAAAFNLELISPLVGILYNSYSDVSLYQVIVPLLIPLFIGIVLIFLHFKRGDKFGV